MHTTVFIGRFQPFHIGHYHIVQQALEMTDHLIIVIGSKDRAPALQHPFSYQKRIDIIKAALTDEELRRVTFTGVYDFDYNNILWTHGVQEAVSNAISAWGVTYDKKISLIGHAKDHTSFYLKMFPQWDSISVDNYKNISATDIRNRVYDVLGFKQRPILDEYFARKYFVNSDHYVAFANALKMQSMELLYKQWEFLNEYRNKWWHRDPKTNEWIVPTFNTVDAVVTLGGNILLIQRGDHPGKDQWALPGGFLNSNERIEAAVIRELSEETKIAVPEPVLRGAIDGRMTADLIDRDPRGRIITHAFHINLTTYGMDSKSNMKINLPKIKGSDDAKKAKWFTLEDFKNMRNQIFSDHFSIANTLIDKQTKN